MNKYRCAVLCLAAQSCPTLGLHGLKPARLLYLWGFSRQEYWSGLQYPPPGDLPNPGIKPRDQTQGPNPGIKPRSPAL